MDMDGRDVASRKMSICGVGDSEGGPFAQDIPSLWDYDCWAAAKSNRRGGSGPPILPPHLLQV